MVGRPLHRHLRRRLRRQVRRARRQDHTPGGAPRDDRAPHGEVRRADRAALPDQAGPI